MVQRYKRPPIAEAVIEVRVEKPIARELIDSLQKKFLAEYPAPPQQSLSLDVEVGEAATKLRQQFQGYKLSSGDGADVLVVGPSVVATSRLAPYEGWEPFVARAKENWDIWKRAVGYQKIARVGVRYVNRIDIPNPEGKAIAVSAYLKSFPVMPGFQQLGPRPMESFALNTAVSLGVDNCQLVLNTSSVQSPLVKTTSFVLDLDVSRELDLPQRDEDLWSLIDRIRAHKNLVFENCITDESRKLFTP